MAKFKAVIFDWDGTLFDSIRYALVIYQKLFRALGVNDVHWRNFRKEFKADYHKYYAEKGVPPSAFNDVDRLWIQLYEAGSKKLKLMPGAKRLLATLRKKGVKLAIVSNGSRRRILDELERNNVRHYFGAVVTGDDIPEFKPSPKGVVYALGELRVRPSDALYVGDMADDLVAGRRAGTKTAAVFCGIHTRERLLEEKPDYCFGKVSELSALFPLKGSK